MSTTKKPLTVIAWNSVFSFPVNVESLRESEFVHQIRNIYKRIDEIAKDTTKAIGNKHKKSRSCVTNYKKISITRHDVFRDSFSAAINLSDAVLTRISYKAYAMSVIGGSRIKELRGERIKMNTTATTRINKLIRRNNGKCECEYCGMQAKYVYFVRIGSSLITRGVVGASEIEYSPRIVGVDSTGLEHKFTIDHIEAVTSGGKNTSNNFVLACERCNRIKSAIPSEVFERDADVIRRILRETSKR